MILASATLTVMAGAILGPLVPAFGVRGVFVAAGAVSAIGGLVLAAALIRRHRARKS